MKIRKILTLASIVAVSFSCSNNSEFPLTDLHVHLKGKFTLEDAVIKSAAENINYGIAFNCGYKFPIHSDSQIDSVVSLMKNYPQFYMAMQAEGREWVNIFPEESRAKFDYIFTDGMTFTDAKGRRNRIWIKEETWIDDEQEFMDYLVGVIVKILNEEPVDIYVNPTYLPAQMADRYDFFWTDERMDKVIDAAVKNNIAIEINNRYRIPSYDFLKRAKKAGAKFTIGTNNADENFSGAEYGREIIKKLRLSPQDFYQPVNKRIDGRN
ncbi:MAG: hypothetical protein JXR66_01875 [Bacteroidales bacterium]|nr:hypothetical protein [Bacteroidales bacterium]